MYQRQFHRFISERFVSNFIILSLNGRDVFCMHNSASEVNFCGDFLMRELFCRWRKKPLQPRTLKPHKILCHMLFIDSISSHCKLLCLLC